MTTLFRRAATAPKFLALRIMFPLCLLSICLSERAAAVSMGWVGESGQQPVNCDDKGNCSLTVPIGGYSVPPGNPNNYGMCGILAVGGNFARARAARIIIVGNSYEVNLQWTGGGVLPPIALEWTCAHLTEFSGLPAPAKFALNLPPPVTASGGSLNRKQIGGKPEACIWTGITGGLPAPAAGGPTRGGPSPDVNTQFETGDKTFSTVQPAAPSLSTYASCYTYTGKSSSWKYARIGPSPLSPTVTTPTNLPGTYQNKFWCFMTGVRGGPITATPQFNAFLDINRTVSPAVYDYYVTSEGLYWNCLPFSQ
jgi:hypothetical protein